MPGGGLLTGFADEPRQGEDLHAWHVLRPLLDVGGYLPWSTGAMRPAALVLVCNEIVHRGRTRVVECGSGASTVVLARLLRERGAGSVAAVEHDGAWAALVGDLLRREALDGVARVVHAPLRGDPPWYASAALDALPPEIDLLVVDGPPAHLAGEEHRRVPALGFFEPRLVPGATVVLDDLHRPGEREVLARWEAETPWRFLVDEVAGVAVGARG
ncbi:MAG: class I SAM-dependent methyltransferase [Solirubrobacterales bacterium]|nr:class I SAM-dependent methyltransferase [Solirubrobacterales bacterium]